MFCAVIDACANDGQYKRAISFLSEMEEKYGVKPNLQCFNSAISACKKAAKWEEAVKLLLYAHFCYFAQQLHGKNQNHTADKSVNTVKSGNAFDLKLEMLVIQEISKTERNGDDDDAIPDFVDVFLVVEPVFLIFRHALL